VMRWQALILFLAPVCAIELTFWIDPQGTECFFDDAYKGDLVSGNFQVTTGGNLEISFSIVSPVGKMMLQKDKVVEEKLVQVVSQEELLVFGALKL